jgi:hypothetical protein
MTMICLHVSERILDGRDRLLDKAARRLARARIEVRGDETRPGEGPGRPAVAMARRSTPTTRKRIDATSAARTPTERLSIVHSSLYLPEPVYEALRKIAFEERLKIHGVLLEGIDLSLRRRGYPSVEASKRARSGPAPKKFDKVASRGRGGSQRNKQREVGAEGRGWQRQFTTQLF